MHTTPTAARAHDRQSAYLASADRSRQVRLARLAQAQTPTVQTPTIPTHAPRLASGSTPTGTRLHRIYALVAGRRQLAVTR